ncbi:MAG: hypothetical protein ACKVOH_05890, partial [Chlamydiales bacterium]
MFRRPGKNPLDEETSLYQQEEPLTSHYKYGGKKLEHPSQDMPSRIFDTTRQPVATPIASPLKEENWGEDKTTSLPHHFKKTMN